MLKLSRPWLAFSYSPLWPSEGAWLGLRMYPPEVEARMQSGLRLLGSCFWPMLWLLALWSPGKGSAPVLPSSAARAVEFAIVATLPPLFWIRFLVCKDPVTRRHALYGLMSVAHAYVGFRGFLNALFDSCDFPAGWIVIARRCAVAAFFAVLQAFSFWQVSVWLCVSSLPGMLVYLYRCSFLTASTAGMVWIPADHLRLAVFVILILIIAIASIIHSRKLSRELIHDTLHQEHERFVKDRESSHSISSDRIWRAMIRSNYPPTVASDLCGLRWLLLHQKRSGACWLSLDAELAISEFLGCDSPHPGGARNGTDDALTLGPLGYVSSVGSASVRDAAVDLQGIRLRLWMSQPPPQPVAE